MRVSSNSEVGGGLKKRYMLFEYEPASETFSLRTVGENGDQALTIPSLAGGGFGTVFTRAGAPASLLDLHSGAQLKVLGKMMTLQKPDGPTGAWNDRHARRLLKIKGDLVAEIQKYKPQMLPPGLTADRGSKVHQGGLNLRNLSGQVESLLDVLHKYRPSKADKIRSSLVTIE